MSGLSQLRWSTQVFARSCVIAFSHERMMHSWWTWTFLWMGRLVAEVSFFALIGRLIGGDDAVEFLLIGAALLAPAYGAMFVAQSVRGLMFDGLVPYLIAAPAPSFPAALGRSIHWCVDGAIAGSLGLIIGNAAFDLGLGAASVAGIVTLVFLCPLVMMGVGLMVGTLATRFPAISNLLSALARSILGLFCGATFAVDYLPAWCRPLSEILPLTHVIRAARDVADGSNPLGPLALALLTGAVWIAWAWWSVQRQFERSRRTGVFV